MKAFGPAREELVDQAIHDAAHRLWRKHDFDPDRGSLGAYFLSAARNGVLGALRAEAIQQRAQLVSGDVIAQRAGAEDPPSSSAADAEAPRDLLSDVMACIGQLSNLQQEVVLADLRHPEATVPAKELARALDTTTNTIYVTRNKARKKLAKLLAERGRWMP